MTGEPRMVAAAIFRVWVELLEDLVAHDPEETARGNRSSAVMLLHELVGAGMRVGAIRAVVIHSSGPSSFAHLMFRYLLNAEFDWNGEIHVATGMEDGVERLITEIVAATGVPDRDDDE